MLLYIDGKSEVCDRSPTRYANVPAEVTREVVYNHYGLHSDSSRLSEMAKTEADTAEQ